MNEHKAIELMHELGVNVEVGTETYEAMLEHPTVKAFIDGDITISQAIFVEEYLANGFNATEAAKLLGVSRTVAAVASSRTSANSFGGRSVSGWGSKRADARRSSI